MAITQTYVSASQTTHMSVYLAGLMGGMGTAMGAGGMDSVGAMAGFHVNK